MQTTIPCLPLSGKHRATLIAAVAVLFSAGTAYAADLGGSFKDAPVMEAAPTWAGLYVGGAVGYGWGDTTERNFVDPYPDNAVEVDGVIYGAHLGYNFQRGDMVLGVEAAFNGANIDGTHEHNSNDGGTYSLKRKLDWYGAVTGRVGLARGDMLFYGLGGAAWAKTKTTEGVVDDGTVADFTHSTNSTKLGWTAGAGIERAITNRISLRLEYAHVEIGHDKIFDGEEDVDLSVDTVKIGASFKLSGDERAPLK